jgi:thiamine biosynthesis protein ThiS
MVLVNDRDKVPWTPGLTVTDVLKHMGYSYVLITVTVNEVFIPKDDYDSFKVPDKADVKAFHLAHGG